MSLNPYLDAFTIVPNSNKGNRVSVIISTNYKTFESEMSIQQAKLTKAILDLNLDFGKRMQLMTLIDNYVDYELVE